jgi:hypothetical protein
MSENFNPFGEQGKNPLLELASDRMFQFGYASQVIAQHILDPYLVKEAEAYISSIERGSTPDIRPDTTAVAGAAVMGAEVEEAPATLLTEPDIAPTEFVDTLAAETPETSPWRDDNELAA